MATAEVALEERNKKSERWWQARQPPDPATKAGMHIDLKQVLQALEEDDALMLARLPWSRTLDERNRRLLEIPIGPKSRLIS